MTDDDLTPTQLHDVRRLRALNQTMDEIPTLRAKVNAERQEVLNRLRTGLTLEQLGELVDRAPGVLARLSNRGTGGGGTADRRRPTATVDVPTSLK